MAVAILPFISDNKSRILFIAYGTTTALAACLSAPVTESEFFAGAPNLGGSDGERYFYQAESIFHYGFEEFNSLFRANYYGIQLYFAAWFYPFGATYSAAVISNVLALLLAFLILHKSTLKLTNSSAAAFNACALAMLTTSHTFHALLLLKEPLLCLSFALLALFLAEVSSERPRHVPALLAVVLATAIILGLRSVLLYTVPLLILAFAPKIAKTAPSMLAVAFGVIVLGIGYAGFLTTKEITFTTIFDSVLENAVVETKLDSGTVDAGGIVGTVLSIYLDLPFAARLALAAVPTSIQALLPFDLFSTEFLSKNFAFFLSRNLHPLWLLIVLPVIISCIPNVFTNTNSLVNRLFVVGLAYYIGIAAVYGGAIPRYASPFLFLLYPAAGYLSNTSSNLSPIIRPQIKRARSALLALIVAYYAAPIIL